MTYRSRAELISKDIESDGSYAECFRYHGREYWVFENNEVPTEMQHYFEQQTIDYLNDISVEEEIEEYFRDVLELEDFQ